LKGLAVAKYVIFLRPCDQGLKLAEIRTLRKIVSGMQKIKKAILQHSNETITDFLVGSSVTICI